MSLNNISLNPQLLAQLYTHTLLDIKPEEAKQPPTLTSADKPTGKPIISAAASPKEEPAPTIASEPAATFGNTPSLGGNKKGILILVQNEVLPFLPDAELEFLSAILGACKLSIADVAIVNLHHFPQSYTSLLQQFESRQILLMGVTPQQIDLPFHFPHFQLQPFDKRTYLAAQPLGLIAQSKELKTQLWSCLKAMFGI